MTTTLPPLMTLIVGFVLFFGSLASFFWLKKARKARRARKPGKVRSVCCAWGFMGWKRR
ncbi:MAG: hypothetical protein ACTSR3_13620 [Candidatus Helarchaeota archaeon]